MRKKICLLMIIALFILSACSFEKIDKIQLYEMESFSNIRKDSMMIIKDKQDIIQIRNGIDSAKKQPGVVDMADPEYKIEVGKNTYYLWISENSGTIMNLEDTNTIYSLTKYSAKRVGEIIKKNK
ncbi:MAG TPA: hypothetical protein VEV44_14225 [Pseudoneobacillus sp.]|nr:hypothetical protein [Pseudoneobacillus sp.]